MLLSSGFTESLFTRACRRHAAFILVQSNKQIVSNKI
jgi:hypothetical protein